MAASLSSHRWLLAVAAVVAVVAGALIAHGSPANAAGQTLRLNADRSGKLRFDKTRLTAKAGSVTIVMANPSSLPHAVVVEGKGLEKKGRVVMKGGTSRVSVRLARGRYEFYCPVDGHKAGGMKGSLVVR